MEGLKERKKGEMEKKHILLADNITFQLFIFIHFQCAFPLKHLVRTNTTQIIHTLKSTELCLHYDITNQKAQLRNCY